MVDYIFWTGVELLKVAAKLLGMTYIEIHVYLFIVLHPLTTLVLCSLLLVERQQKR